MAKDKKSCLTFTARITFRAEKPYGRDRVVVHGYRAEITEGLPNNVFCYTGLCETKDDAKTALIARLKDLGFSGVVHFEGEHDLRRIFAIEIEKCQCCKIAIASPKHMCPYKQDIHDDSETLCNCCEKCEQQCADDI